MPRYPRRISYISASETCLYIPLSYLASALAFCLSTMCRLSSLMMPRITSAWLWRLMGLPARSLQTALLSGVLHADWHEVSDCWKDDWLSRFEVRVKVVSRKLEEMSSLDR